MLNESDSRLIWGIKAFASISVIYGHIIMKDVMGRGMDVIEYSHISNFFVNNVAMFSFLSGYLVSLKYAESREMNGGGVLKKIVKRYFRFSIPLFFVCIIIVCLQYIFGFSEWYRNGYESTLTYRGIFKYVFWDVYWGNTKYNGAFWMITDIFWGNIIIEFILMIEHIFWNQKKLILNIIWLIALASSLRFRYVLFDCFLGVLFPRIEKKFNELKNKTFFVKSLFLIEIINVLIALGKRNGYYINYYLEVIFTAIAILVIFFTIKNNKVFRRIFGNKMLVVIGKRSFYMFCFHWAIICSYIHYIIYISALNVYNHYLLFGIEVTLTYITTYLLSEIFYRIECFGKWISKGWRL